jgi:hypothetical protein
MACRDPERAHFPDEVGEPDQQISCCFIHLGDEQRMAAGVSLPAVDAKKISFGDWECRALA